MPIDGCFLCFLSLLVAIDGCFLCFPYGAEGRLCIVIVALPVPFSKFLLTLLYA